MSQQSTRVSRFIAFLRAINVGGRTVKMDHLRRLFVELEYSGVETFIASGNVIFSAPDEQRPLLEPRIESHLRERLGYQVATFVRFTAQVAAIAAYQPFSTSEMEDAGNTLYIAFLRATPDAAAQQRLLSYRTEVDDFHVQGREVYWLCRKRISKSTFSGGLLEKILGAPATVRNATTVRKLATKYAAAQ